MFKFLWHTLSSAFTIVSKIVTSIVLVFVLFAGLTHLPNNFLSSLLPNSTHEKVTVNSILSNIDEIQELCTVRYGYEKVSDISSTKYYFFDKKIVIGCKGTIKYGYDLSQLTTNNISISHQCVTIRLPEPVIISNELDTGSMRVIHGDDSFFNRITPQDMVTILNNIKREALQDLNNNSYLQECSRNAARRSFESLVRAIDSHFTVQII